MKHLIPTWVDGNLQPVEKLEAHKRGLRHKAVSVFILKGQEILLQKRALGKYHTPGLWANSCCTHPHWDEDAEICAHRRLREELGIDDQSLRHCDQVEYRADVGGGLTEHEVVDIFRADVDAAPSMALDPDEVAETKWVELSKLAADIEVAPEIYTPWLRIYLQEHSSKIFD